MSGSALINLDPLNVRPINTSYHIDSIDAAAIAVNVNPRMPAQIDAQPLNINPVGGPDVADVRLIQVHILDVEDAAIAVAAESPALSMIHLLSVHNARIPISVSNVRLSRTQGGALLVKVTTPESDVYRYSFEGVKA